jgi:uncharacterized membrane protein YdfJ with MMPL/SSD domain
MSLAALLAAFTIGLALAQSPTSTNVQTKPVQEPRSKIPPSAPSNSHAVRVGPDAIDGSKPVIVKRNNN